MNTDDIADGLRAQLRDLEALRDQITDAIDSVENAIDALS